MANPLAWLPFHGDKPSRRAALLGGALTASLFMHVGLPFMRWHSVEAVSETPVTITFMPPPPIPLPEAEELKPVPNEEDSPAPPQPDMPVQKEIKQAEPDPVPEPDPPEDVKDPPPDATPPAVVPTPTPNNELAERVAELERRRAERIAERQRRRAEREAALAAKKAQKGAGGEKGGAPLTGKWATGRPDSVFMCNAEDRGDELHITATRPLSEWIPIVPTVLAGFDTRPGLGGYLDKVQQVISRDRTQLPKRIGFIELSLPNDVMQFPLEEPRGVRLAVGRLDARCLVGFKYASNLFPFTMSRVPARIIDGMNNSVAALIDVTFYKDASLEVHASDGSPLPFTRGRLKNSKGIKENIEDHYQAARLAKGIADLFGIHLGPTRTNTTPPPPARPAPKKPAALAGARPTKKAGD